MSFATINPATGQTVQKFQFLTDSQIEERLQRSADTFLTYRLSPFARRSDALLKAAAILDAEKERFARTMTLEMGKLYSSALDEVAKCAWVCRYCAENGERFLAEEMVATPARRSSIQHQPLGPVLAVMPWNFPFWQVFRFAAPALMAGNVGLLKHAPNVPQCALQIEEIFRKAGFPEGTFQNLFVPESKVDAILDDPRVVAATLTGSEEAGIQVGIAAAKRVKKVVLELGGADPFIVMPSAKLDRAVTTAVKARIINNGQSCIAAKRFIVAEPVADEFIRSFVATMQALKVGDPFSPSTDLGPLASEEGLAHIEQQVRQTIEAGATAMTGGEKLDGPGYFYPPTVLANIPEKSPGYSEELFGPVACMFRVDNLDEAIRVANSSRYGLGASVWTNDSAEQDRFIRDLETGMVFVNRMVASDPRLPFGGVKRSGHGRELGSIGIREFVNTKTVWVE